MEPMRDIRHEQQTKPVQSREEAVLAGWTLQSYLTRIRIPALAVVIAEMVLLIIWKYNVVVWLLDLALFVYLVVSTADLTFRRAAILGATAGFLAGFGIAIFRLIFIRDAYYILNLIAEPALTALLGAAVSSVFFQFLQQRQMKKVAAQAKRQEKEDEKQKKNAPTTRPME